MSPFPLFLLCPRGAVRLQGEARLPPPTTLKQHPRTTDFGLYFERAEGTPFFHLPLINYLSSAS